MATTACSDDPATSGADTTEGTDGTEADAAEADTAEADTAEADTHTAEADTAEADTLNTTDTEESPDTSEPQDAADSDTAAPDAADTTGDTSAVDTTPAPPVPSNILILIADDFGLDSAPCYGIATSAPTAPTLEALCDRGVRFERAWATPICSPTRATLLTGQYSTRHGVLAPVNAANSLPADATTLAALAGAAGYATANFGKWHLGNSIGATGQTAPNAFGWDHFSGTLQGGLPSYFSWTKITNGSNEDITGYATTDVIDDTIAWIDAQTALDKPWLAWVAFNAPHAPFHVPPTALHTDASLPTPGDCPQGRNRDCYLATIEALDTELNRLFEHLDDGRLEAAHVVFIGDNGTPRQVAEAPVTNATAKGTVSEGGVRVPFVIAGPSVTDGGRAVSHITTVADLFPTLLDLIGQTPPADLVFDGVSLLPHLQTTDSGPHRPLIFAQIDTANGEAGEGATVRDDTYKFIKYEDGTERLYNLNVDPWESTNLIEDPSFENTVDSLRSQLNAVLAQ